MVLASNPEFAARSKGMPIPASPVPTDSTIAGLRDQLSAMMARGQPPPISEDLLKTTIHEIPSFDGTTIQVYEFRPTSSDSTTPGPAIMHYHGGGMIFGHVTDFAGSLAGFALQTKTPLFSVEYRLAPEHRHPIPAEDCYAALKWLVSPATAGNLNIDPQRVCVMGQSAGAGIAAGVALMARDRVGTEQSLGKISATADEEIKIAKLLLIYPMLDHRNTKGPQTAQDHALAPLLSPGWGFAHNVYGWAALLGRDDHVEHPEAIQGLEYASPSVAKDLTGLPDMYIDIGGLDLFRDEVMEFARRLATEGGNNVELHVLPGLPHGFERMMMGTGLLERVMAGRVAFLTSF